MEYLIINLLCVLIPVCVFTSNYFPRLQTHKIRRYTIIVSTACLLLWFFAIFFSIPVVILSRQNSIEDIKLVGPIIILTPLLVFLATYIPIFNKRKKQGAIPWIPQSVSCVFQFVACRVIFQHWSVQGFQNFNDSCRNSGVSRDLWGVQGFFLIFNQCLLLNLVSALFLD